MSDRQPASNVVCLTLCAAMSSTLLGCADEALRPVEDIDGTGVLTDAGAAPQISPPQEPALPYPPASATPASLTPCPTGWSEVAPTAPDAVTTCEPWPEGNLEPCPDSMARFPGDIACAHIGLDCDEQGWSRDLPTARVIYVDVAATDGGDGTRNAPFRTIEAATQGAVVDTVIALRHGLYDEAVSIPSGVTLWGACVAETVVVNTATAGPGGAPNTIVVEGPDVQIRNVRISGTHVAITASGPDRSVHVQDVIIDNTDTTALQVADRAVLSAHTVVIRSPSASSQSAGPGIDAKTGARLQITRVIVENRGTLGMAVHGVGTSVEARDAAIRGTHVNSVDQSLGDGIDVWDGAQVIGERVIIENNRTRGIDIFAGATGRFTDVVVRATQRSSDPGTVGQLGHGVSVRSAGTAILTRALVANNNEAGILIEGQDSHGQLIDTVVRDTGETDGGESRGLLGYGLWVRAGASAGVQRAVFLGNHDANIHIENEGVRASLEDVIVHRGQPRNHDSNYGNGLNAKDGAQVHVQRGLFSENGHAGVIASDTRTELILDDITVRDTTHVPGNRQSGEGLLAEKGAHVILNRALFTRNRTAGMVAVRTDTHLSMTDITVTDTRASDLDDSLGVGIAIVVAATGELTRGYLANNHAFGIVTGVLGTLDFTDLTVRDNQARRLDQDFGRALYVAGGGSICGRRAVIEDNREIGIMVDNAGSVADLEHVVIRSTMPRLYDGKLGYGVGAYRDGALMLRNFAITDNALLGVQVANGGHIELHDGVVSGHAIGVNIQDGSLDLDNLQNNVLYIDNNVTWRGHNLPVPNSEFTLPL